MKVGEIKEIIDGVYFQKLSLLLGNLQNWQKKKEEIFAQMYVSDIQGKLCRLQKNQKQVKNELLQFIKVLNMQYQFLSKLKKQEKPIEISSVFGCLQSFGAQFTIIKDSLLQLSDFLGKFMGVTNYEYVQMKKIYDQVNEIKGRYQQQKNKFTQNYNQKKQLVYSKKNMKKHFELAHILDLVSELQKQRKVHEQAFMRLHNSFNKQLQAKQRLYKDITDNLQFVSKLYQSGFRKEILSAVSLHFKKKLQDSTHELNQFRKQQQPTSNYQRLIKSAKEEFYKYFDSFIQEITVGNWSVAFQKMKQTQGRVSNQQQSTHMFLTFDKKIFFYKLLKREIQFQQTIEDVKIYEPSEDGKFLIKNKKTKQKFVVHFDRIQKQDQFFLHINQMLKQK